MTGGAASHWGDPGRRSVPSDPESEDLLALATAVAWSFANPAYGFQGRKDPVTGEQSSRTRGDLCPGVLRPWPADDGLLVRLRLVGGRLTGQQIGALLKVARRFGDGAVHLTSRANLQVRGLGSHGLLPEPVVAAFEQTGLLPSRTHELVRNILVSPQSGYAGGRADLRPVAAELDALLLADPRLSDLPGRFLFVLDDGRGDLWDRRCDLGLVALDQERAQVRVGEDWGAIVPLASAASELARLASRFVSARGTGPAAAWHVRELADGLAPTAEPDRALPAGVPALEYGPVPGGTHHRIPDGVLTDGSAFVAQPVLVVTPWRGIFVPDPAEQT